MLKAFKSDNAMKFSNKSVQILSLHISSYNIIVYAYILTLWDSIC